MNWNQSAFFRFLRKFLRLVTKPMKTIWSSEFDRKPSVFVCNHDSSYGPISMCVHFDLCAELAPWINALALKAKDIPSYVRTDFWWPRDKWYTKILDYTVTYIIALILPPILRGSACIPVRHDTGVMGTLRGSVDALKSGKHILLFPETPIGYREYGEEINTGFVSLGRLLHRRTGETVNFFPVFIDWKGKEISVGEPLAYAPETDYNEQAASISKAIEAHFQKYRNTPANN